MKKYLTRLIKNKHKFILKSLIEAKSVYGEINYFAFKLKKKCKLGSKGDRIFIPLDEIITSYILRYGCWDPEIVDFIKKNIKKKDNILIDIGANIGLMTRQLILSKIKFKKIFCIEPNSENFKLLKENLCIFRNIKYLNCGLGQRKSISKIYLNKYNFGDYSFKNKTEKYEKAIIENVNSFFKKNIKNNKNIIYKSDTQGMDEEILLSLDKKYFQKIYILIIEITNHAIILKNKNNFIDILRNFKKFSSKDRNILSINEILNKIENKNEFDLFMSK